MRAWERTLVAVAVATGMAFTASVHAQSARNAQLCEVIQVTDGDTIDVECAGSAYTLRLKCIDAPERSQDPWGARASRALRQGLEKKVRVVAHEQDPYGRTVATVYTADGRQNYNLAMVRGGHAAVYDRYCSNESYSQAEAKARAEGRGIWSESGLHQRPWRYRHAD